MCQSVYQIASGNSRLFVDQVCLPAQEALEQDPAVALRNSRERSPKSTPFENQMFEESPTPAMASLNRAATATL